MQLDPTIFERINRLISNTPLIELDWSSCHLFAKIEANQFTGSIKDRAAAYIIRRAVENGLINQGTTIVESSSGNFGIALAALCRVIGLTFVPVIDPNITKEKENLLRLLASRVIKVTKQDSSGGYLLTRMNAVRTFLMLHPNSYNPNQYENPDNYLAYYNTLALELCDSFDTLDYAFISVSTGGTITGVSVRLKERFDHVKIVAVDVEGSLVFSGVAKTRRIPGMGASLRSSFLDIAKIDDALILTEKEIVMGCFELLNEQGVFGGPSSGAAYYAAKRVLSRLGRHDVNAVIICPDKGNAYLDTVYNRSWATKVIE